MEKRMRANIIKAIIHREFLEYINNSQAILLLGMTVCLNSFLFFALGTAQMVLTLNMSLILLGFTNTMMLFSEEKDQRTLDALLTTPATFQEIIVGKLTVNYLITFTCTLILFFFLHRSDVSLVHLPLLIAQGALIFCLLGTCVGIILPNQKVANSFGSLIMLTFLLPELLAPVNKLVGHFARGLPTYYLNQALQLSTKAPLLELSKYYAVIIIFGLISLGLVLSLVRNLLHQESPKWSYSPGNKLFLGLFLSLFLISSLLFRPTEWVISNVKGVTYYSNANYELSVPSLDSKEYSYKNIDDGNTSTLIFKSKGENNHYLFLKVRRNWKNVDLDQYLKSKKEKWSKLKSIKNLKISDTQKEAKQLYREVVFNDEEGANLIYYRVEGKWIYHIGLVEKKVHAISEKNRQKMTYFINKVVWSSPL
jgi:ABC-2 type transport system permease protein